MQETLFRTLTFKALVLALIINKEVAEIDTSFLAFRA